MDILVKARSLSGESVEIRSLMKKCMVGLQTREVKQFVIEARSAKDRKDYQACVSAAAKAAKLDRGNATAKALMKECKEKKDLEGMKF